MKTAEEWENFIQQCCLTKECTIIEQVRMIQLDAMKEGMRKGARINRGNMDKWKLTKEKDTGWGAEVSALDILIASEQLTIKDL